MFNQHTSVLRNTFVYLQQVSLQLINEPLLHLIIVLNKYFSLPIILFFSITSLSHSITRTRRLWSCAQRTPKTVTSGWLLSHRLGTCFTRPFTFKHNWQCPERKSDLRMCVTGEWKMQLNLHLKPFF